MLFVTEIGNRKSQIGNYFVSLVPLCGYTKFLVSWCLCALVVKFSRRLEFALHEINNHPDRE
jgi:hypothetical protein